MCRVRKGRPELATLSRAYIEYPFCVTSLSHHQKSTLKLLILIPILKIKKKRTAALPAYDRENYDDSGRLLTSVISIARESPSCRSQRSNGAQHWSSIGSSTRPRSNTRPRRSRSSTPQRGSTEATRRVTLPSYEW